MLNLRRQYNIDRPRAIAYVGFLLVMFGMVSFIITAAIYELAGGSYTPATVATVIAGIGSLLVLGGVAASAFKAHPTR